ncbi:unnamed protein product (macronuclear) [Paramecium tetraurelia]|uniref:SprT-like domain-containing protein n=1 Tax=Paramecium tetraurelia TaxID=5888 RepID=A0E957_PARTE|nr:uncharacterized protein GSPATT00024555001 [Paramecium tetraurelia]CAK91824.1 unnamed protein product [Paramecium tetraurelia]|eukprot:XP_001459221.1 hypothetical protein (macronuclear) [Paramecium tetraurelia strain d4-2]
MMSSVRSRENRKHSQASKSLNFSLPKRASSQIKIHHLPSISNNSTCCSNSNTSSPPQSCSKLEDDCVDISPVSKNTSEDPLNYFNYEDFNSILPITINGVKILKVDWSYFSAPPNNLSRWKAHCFWTVGYTFDINMKKMKKSSNIKYRLVIQSWCCLNNKSWVKNKWDRLLEHETGHYLIGCLCALEFKQKADKFKYTKNYRMECTKLFQDTFQYYLQMERQYDEETNHSQNVSKQKEWNEFIKAELLKY